MSLTRCLALAAAVAFASPASASLLITIDKSAQRMIVALDDLPVFDWPVSTGKDGHDTPVGEFKPFRMEKTHFSREWDDAPMPNSIFFTTEGHAIHGSYDVKHLGSPASHGCVRLSPQNAATLFALVKQEKMANTRVVLSGEIPVRPAQAAIAKREAGDDEDLTASVEPRASRNADRNARDWRSFRSSRPFFNEDAFFGRRYRRSDDDRRAPGAQIKPYANGWGWR